MANYYKENKEFHYINPSYGVLINGEKYAIKPKTKKSENTSSTFKESDCFRNENIKLDEPKINHYQEFDNFKKNITPHYNDYAFQCDLSFTEEYRYAPYYDRGALEEEKKHKERFIK